MKTLALLAAFVLCSLALPAVAQDAGPPDGGAADMAQAKSVAGAKDDFAEGANLISRVVGAGSARDWRAMGAALILLVVFLVRNVAGRYIAFFKTDRGGALSALVIGVLGTVGSLIGASGKFSMGMVLDGLMAAFTAAGGYSTIKKLCAPSDAPAKGGPTGVVATALVLCCLMTLNGCSATWGTAFKASEKACQVANVPSVEQGALTQVTSILADPLSWEAGLLALGAQIGYEQVKCLVMAVQDAIKATHATAARLAMTSSEQAILDHAAQFLAKH